MGKYHQYNEYQFHGNKWSREQLSGIINKKEGFPSFCLLKLNSFFCCRFH